MAPRKPKVKEEEIGTTPDGTGVAPAPAAVTTPGPEAKPSKTEITVKFRDHNGEETSRTYTARSG